MCSTVTIILGWLFGVFFWSYSDSVRHKGARESVPGKTQSTAANAQFTKIPQIAEKQIFFANSSVGELKLTAGGFLNLDFLSRFANLGPQTPFFQC